MLSSFANTVIATQCLNIVLHLLVFPIVSLRDTDAPTNVPTSVEYNIQTNSIVGVLSYGSALWFLLSAEETTANPIAKWLVSYCDWNQQLIALCIAACYEFNGIIFASCYCQPYAKKSLNKTFQAVSVPVYVLSLLLLILVPGNEKYMNYITVAGSSFFMFRMLLMILDYIHSSTATTITYPKETNVTMGIQRQPSSKSVTVPETSSNIWKIYGHEYDVTDFVQHHPGGVESIMLAANRHDCTALFQSYHAFNIHKAKAVLEKYRISPTPTSNEDKDKKLLGSYPVGHHNDLFYEELVKRVSKVLRDNGIDPVKDRYASWERYFMYLVIVSSIVTCGYYHVKGNLLGSLLLGVMGSYMGALIGHDGGHYAISSFPWLNDLFVWGMSFICNPIVWQHQHTFAHHSFTNVHEHDPDLHHFTNLIRYSPLHKVLPQYSMQIHVLYIFWAFGFTSNGTCYWNTWRFIFERSLHGTVEWTDRKRWLRTSLMLFHLVAYPTLNFIVPYFYHRSLLTTILCGGTQMITAGFLFALLSQVGHITELALVRDPVAIEKSRSDIAKVSWAAEQVETTNDYCPDSQLMIVLEGQLNVQIEHHLFPSLNHRHLYMIQPTVEETCLEHGVVYKKYKSWTDAMSDTIAHLQKLATNNDQNVQQQANITTKKFKNS